jgi:lipid-A-disaccharide synthase-like uncharacterized protein
MNLIVPYSATVISISGRFVFMYLLYTKKSTNSYSLLFSVMNIVSSTLWIQYSQITDTPLLVRSSSDLLFSISTIYIHNRSKTVLPLHVTVSSPSSLHTFHDPST